MSEPETITSQRADAERDRRGFTSGSVTEHTEARPPADSATPTHGATRADNTTPENAASPADAEQPDERLAALQRIDRGVYELRGLIEAKLREEAYHEFSIARLIGAVLQVIVVGLVVLALLDWIFSGPLNTLLTKLAFAAFFQLAALTAFVVSQARR